MCVIICDNECAVSISQRKKEKYIKVKKGFYAKEIFSLKQKFSKRQQKRRKSENNLSVCEKSTKNKKKNFLLYFFRFLLYAMDIKIFKDYIV